MYKILLVEDNPDDIVIIKKLLKGFEVEEAQTGREGIEMLKKDDFDCVLLDYRLPDTNALKVLSEIRRFSSSPVIILTGIKDERLITGTSRLGAVGFLVKDEINTEILSSSILNAITSEKKEEFLAKTEGIYEKLIDSMNEGLFALDIQDVIVFTNKRMEEMFQNQSLMGKNLSSIMDNGEYRVFKKNASKSKPTSFEFSFSLQDGSSLPVLISSSPLFDKNGVFNGFLCVVTDLSRLKEMEEMLSLAQKLAGASYVASQAAHDIRNPLSTVVAGIYMIRRFMGGDEKVERIISQIEGACHRMNTYIEDLLHFSSPLSVNLRNIEINSILKEFLDDPFFKELKGIEIKEELEEGLPFISGDPERLKQVLFNLIKNACDSMQQGGIIKIKTYQNKDFVGIDITDVGGGIDEEHLDKIFSPFFTTKGKGVGLGLCIVKKIIDSHKGEIRVESKKDKGTTFTILLKKSFT
ncbi:MAG: ATP-binding protein [bacterium]